MQSLVPPALPPLFIVAILLPMGLHAQEAGTGDSGDTSQSAGIDGHEFAESIQGRTVVNAIGEEIGDISNLIVSGDRLTHAIISIGGFVGLGGSDVVVPFGVLRFEGEEVMIDTLASADQIQELTLFEPQDFGLTE